MSASFDFFLSFLKAGGFDTSSFLASGPPGAQPNASHNNPPWFSGPGRWSSRFFFHAGNHCVQVWDWAWI